MIRASAGSVARFEPEPAHFGDQRSASDPQTCCGSVSSAHHPLRIFESLQNVVASGVFQSLRARDFAVLGHSLVGTELAESRLKYLASGHDHAMLDEVLKLADIARPIVSDDLIHYFRRDDVDHFIHTFSVQGDKMPHQQGNIVASIAEWR